MNQMASKTKQVVRVARLLREDPSAEDLRDITAIRKTLTITGENLRKLRARMRKRTQMEEKEKRILRIKQKAAIKKIGRLTKELRGLQEMLLEIGVDLRVEVEDKRKPVTGQGPPAPEKILMVLMGISKENEENAASGKGSSLSTRVMDLAGRPTRLA